MRSLGTALVGCGFMGQRHLRGYGALAANGVDNARVVAVMDIAEAAAESAADEAEKLLGERPRVYTSMEALLLDEDVEAVDIVTDPRTHHGLAVQAMDAGRHVLCEKPLALTVSAARTMVAASQRTGMVLATAENYRRGGSNRLAKAVIDSGMLGELHLFREFRVGGDSRVIISKWRHLKATGSIGLDMCIHYADIIEYLVGPVETVWGRGIIAEPLRYPANGEQAIVADGEDTLFAQMRTVSGVEVQLAYLPSGPGHHYGERSVHGTKGSMQIPTDRTDGDVVVHLAQGTLTSAQLRADLDGSFQLPGATTAVLGPDGTGGKGAPWAVVDSGYLAVEIHDFADAVLAGRRPEVDGAAGLRDLAVVNAILESGASGRAVTVQDVLDGTVHAYQDAIDASLEVSTR